MSADGVKLSVLRRKETGLVQSIASENHAPRKRWALVAEWESQLVAVRAEIAAIEAAP